MLSISLRHIVKVSALKGGRIGVSIERSERIKRVLIAVRKIKEDVMDAKINKEAAMWAAKCGRLEAINEDLLDALENAYAELRSFGHRANPDIVAQAKEAIAKAKGE